MNNRANGKSSFSFDAFFTYWKASKDQFVSTEISSSNDTKNIAFFILLFTRILFTIRDDLVNDDDDDDDDDDDNDDELIFPRRWHRD